MYLQYMGMTMERCCRPVCRAGRKAGQDAPGDGSHRRLYVYLFVSDEEFDAEVKRIADAYKMEEDKVRSIVDADAVKQDLAVNKAIDFVKEKANVTTEQVDDSTDNENA